MESASSIWQNRSAFSPVVWRFATEYISVDYKQRATLISSCFALSRIGNMLQCFPISSVVGLDFYRLLQGFLNV